MYLFQKMLGRFNLMEKERLWKIKASEMLQ